MTRASQKPIFIPAKAAARVASFKKRAVRVADDYENQLIELFAVRNPSLRRAPDMLKEKAAAFAKRRGPKSGAWVYFPWSRALSHILEWDELYELRSARNRNLITEVEQRRLRRAPIAIAGMSVGASVAHALVLEGAEVLRIADSDTLSLSNMNRIRASVAQLGMNKTEAASQSLYELHPYLNLTPFPEGLRAASLRRFIAGPPKLSVLVDEMDDLFMKIELRKMARRLRIPVVSAADNGDGAIVDVERFDTEPRRPLFHGNIPELSEREIVRMNFGERIALINRMVGFSMVRPRMKASVREVGKSLYSWPQLGGAAMASGAAVAYVVTHLLRGENIRSGKYNVAFERIIK